LRRLLSHAACDASLLEYAVVPVLEDVFMSRFAPYIVAACLVAVCLSSGCTRATLARSPHERSQQWKQVAKRDRLALNDDVDFLLQKDRPTRLTRWHDR